MYHHREIFFKLFAQQFSYNRASSRSRKKSQISRDFQGQIRVKNGRFRGNFTEIFEANFSEKRLVKNGRFHENFPSKFRWKAIGFALRFQWNLMLL